jgi:hypothetical protein
MFLAGAGCGPSPAQDIPRRDKMFLAGSLLSRRHIAFSPAQHVPRRHKMFLTGARCFWPAQDVPRRHKMFLAGAASSKRSLIGAVTASGPS